MTDWTARKLGQADSTGMNIHAEINRIFKTAGQEQHRTVAQAAKAQEALRELVLWHQRNEDATLPSDLLAMLVAARRWA